MLGAMKTTLAAAAVLLLLVAAPAATAAPSSRTYKASLTGTQESTWSFSEDGTCTGDDMAEYQFKGSGGGTAQLAFRTQQPMKVVVYRVGRTKRWGFNYQASPILPSQRRQAIYVEGKRNGTHSQFCPNNETASFASPTSGCGDRTYRLSLKASLNLPHTKRGELSLEAADNAGATASGAKWGADCPYFFGLNPTLAHPNDDFPHHIPGGGLLEVRKQVGTSALRRGKTLVITGKRTVPYDQESDEGDTRRHTRGSTTVSWRLTLTPVKRKRKN